MTALDWFARVAHDLRDPLSPLHTAVYLLRSGDLAEEDRTRLLDMIERQGVRLAAMIDELSDCLRAQRGQLLTRRDEVDLATLALLAVARPDAAPVRCESEIGSLPLHGDDARLLQLLRILRELHLSREELLPAPLIVEREGKRACLQRRLACPPELLSQAQALLEGPLPQSLGEGLGLQLPLAAAIARAHGGELRAQAQPDGHLAVTVELPLIA